MNLNPNDAKALMLIGGVLLGCAALLMIGIYTGAPITSQSPIVSGIQPTPNPTLFQVGFACLIGATCLYMIFKADFITQTHPKKPTPA